VRYVRFLLASWILLSACQDGWAVESAQNDLSVSVSEAGETILSIPNSALGELYMFSSFPPSSMSTSRTRLISFRRSGDGDTVDVLWPDAELASGTRVPADGIVATNNDTLVRHVGIHERLPVVAETADGVSVDISGMLLSDPGNVLGRSVLTQHSSMFDAANFAHASVISAKVSVAASGDSKSAPTTFLLRWGFHALPAKAMDPRWLASGMAFDTTVETWGVRNPSHRRPITRFRLEDNAEKPPGTRGSSRILFFLDPKTPQPLVDWIKEGVKAWNIAFERAGFPNAIEVSDPPAGADWDLFSVAHSTIRIEDRANTFGDYESTGPSPIESGGGTGKKLTDPRTGEILVAHVLLSAQFERLKARFFAGCGALVDGVDSLSLPEDLRKRIYLYLVGHETGHALGLVDGNFGEAANSTDELRNAEWLQENSFAAVMGYGSCNYVAQPMDGVDPLHLVPRIGEADIQQIVLGYSSPPTKSSLEGEAWLLDLREAAARSRRTSFVPGFRPSLGPQFHNLTSEAADPITSSKLGMLNLERNVDLLADLARSDGVDKRIVRSYYDEIFDLYFNQMDHVLTLVGGIEVEADLDNPTTEQYLYKPVPAERQQEAAVFFSTKGFQAHPWLLDSELSTYADPTMVISRRSDGFYRRRLALLYKRLVREAFNSDRLVRMTEFEGDHNPRAYRVSDYFEDMRMGIWSEIHGRKVSVSYYRQHAQEEYVAVLMAALSLDPPVHARYGYTERAIMVPHSKRLLRDIERAIPRAQDDVTEGHLRLMARSLRDATANLH